MGMKVPSAGAGAGYAYGPSGRSAYPGTGSNAAAASAAEKGDSYIPSAARPLPSFMPYTPAAASGAPDASEKAGPAVGYAPSAGASGATGPHECRTCAERTYQDGSNDPGVSFKTAAHLSPEAAASAVMSHEGEHVVNEQLKASAEGKTIVRQNVVIHTAVCPECGKFYVSGGTTTTVTRSSPAEANGRGIDITV